MVMKGNDVYNFADYEDISLDLQGYLMTVADADNISDLSLDEINDFLNGLDACNFHPSP